MADKEIKKGDIFTSSNLTAKRPGDGLSPEWEKNNWEKIDKKYKIDDQIFYP